ncbi:MAG: VOC family protein [Oscillospiraceae bacterium]|nr:VOC family protein [Oscillospiraceae bacterium]
MQLELFINFDGNCREAVEFYARVFRSEVDNLMTYADAPPDPNHPMQETDKDRIMYAGVTIGGMTVMFMDMPTGEPLIVGNNITPTFSTDSKDEVVRLFNELKEGGTVYMEPSQAFFSELYCMVEDKFGIIWQILHYVPQA